MASSSRSSPVPHKQLSIDIQGTKTDLIISSYEDHLLVLATQIGSMGTILQARKEQGLTINPTFTVSVIFGKRDEPMLVACARKLIEHISSSGSSKSLVLSLGLKDHSTETMKAIVAAVIENRLWYEQDFEGPNFTLSSGALKQIQKAVSGPILTVALMLRRGTKPIPDIPVCNVTSKEYKHCT